MLAKSYDFISTQRQIEFNYSRKHVMKKIRKFLLAQPEVQEKIAAGGRMLSKWLTGEFHETKRKRLDQLNGMNMEDIVRDIITHSSILVEPELFVGFTAQVAHTLGFDDRGEAIQTVGEIIVVLAELDAYDIVKQSRNASLMVHSRINLPQNMRDAVARSHFMPPMIVEPELVENNHQSPYLTFNDCQILGKNNTHLGDICLDVINIQNGIPLALDVDFLRAYDEQPTHALDTLEKQKLWRDFKHQSIHVYKLIVDTGNLFWLTNKVDPRGRLYAIGYHINTMGTAYKKASINFAEKEMVTGVPTQ